MSFKILYVTATPAEARALASVKGIVSKPGGYIFGGLQIDLLISGVGIVPAAWSIMNYLRSEGKPDLAINGGIAGSFRKEEYVAGDVVMPQSDFFADAGIEDGRNFLTLFETGLADKDEPPFRNGVIPADPEYAGRLARLIPAVKALTSGTGTGTAAKRDMLIRKYNPDIETMEGASFFYICARERVHFTAIRAISNTIEPRNRDAWNIPLALENLSLKLEEVLTTLK